MNSDQEIIAGLIARNERVTRDFFFGRCRPLFCNVIKMVFDGNADYDELVNELYLHLMENDAARLRGFEFRSSVYQWLKVLAIRYFIKKRDRVIEDVSHEPLYIETDCAEDKHANIDLERLFDKMPNKRYVEVIRLLMIEDREPEQLAQEMNISTANLYNIKRRAMAQLTRTALKDIEEYGKH